MLFENKIETFDDFLSEAYYFDLPPLNYSDFHRFNYYLFEEAWERFVDINGKRYVILLSKSKKDNINYFRIDFNVGDWGEAYIQNLSKEDYALLKAELKRTFKFGEKIYKGCLFSFSASYNGFKSKKEKEDKIKNLSFDDIQIKDEPIHINGETIYADSHDKKIYIINNGFEHEITIEEFKDIIRNNTFNPQVEQCLNGKKKYTQRVMLYDKILTEMGYTFYKEFDGNFFYIKKE